MAKSIKGNQEEPICNKFEKTGTPISPTKAISPTAVAVWEKTNTEIRRNELEN